MRKWTDEDEARLELQLCIGFVVTAIVCAVLAGLAVKATFF